MWLASLTPFLSDSVLDNYLQRVVGPVWIDDSGDPLHATLDVEIYDLWLIDRSGQIRERFPHPNVEERRAELVQRAAELL